MQSSFLLDFYKQVVELPLLLLEWCQWQKCLIQKNALELAMISSSIALAVSIGPLVGGAITNTLGWPYLFLIMVISFVGIVLLMKFMPKYDASHSSEPFHFDFIGAIILFALIATILLGVNINPLMFVLSFVLLFLFKVRMTKAKYPFIDIELFNNKPFLRLITIGFIMNVALCANLLLIPLLLVERNGISPFLNLI